MYAGDLLLLQHLVDDTSPVVLRRCDDFSVACLRHFGVNRVETECCGCLNVRCGVVDEEAFASCGLQGIEHLEINVIVGFCHVHLL